MFREDFITMNNGHNINLASTIFYLPAGYERGFYGYSEGVSMPMTVINTKDYWDQAESKQVISPTQWNDFLSWRTDSQLEDPSYILLKSFIEENTVFLWGSLEKGGCAYYNSQDPDRCGIVAVYGFVKQQADPTYKRYAATPIVDGFTRVESTEVAFGYDNINTTSIPPQLKCWYIYQGYRDESVTDDYLSYGDYNSILSAWDFVSSTMDLGAMIGVTTWTEKIGSTDMVPVRLWDNLSQNPTRLYKTMFYANLNVNDILYGYITGEAEVDPSVNPSIKGGTTEPGGFDGDYPNRSDEIDFSDPSEMTTDALNSGFITLYNPTKTQVKSFSNFLWTDITDSLSQQIKKIIANPLDAVLFVAMAHFSPPTTGVQQVIKYCGISTGVSAALIDDSQYVTLNCGSIQVEEGTNSFLDYNPYSKAHLFLPYVGINQIDINDIMGSLVEIQYHIDLITGSALAQVKCSRNERRLGDADLKGVMYEFPCNVYEQLPLSASDWRAAISNMTSLVSGAVGVATGNGAGLGAMASAVASQQVSVVRSGSASGNYGYVSNQKPYLILERPINNIPIDFPMYEGFTANIKYKLGNLSGYTEVDSDTWKSEKVLGTEDEMKEIKDLLDSGIFL